MSETGLDSPARTPASVGRGRGVLQIPASFLGSPVVGSDVALGVNRVDFSIGPPDITDMRNPHRQPVTSSTPHTEHVAPDLFDQVGSIALMIGEQIADSIISRLNPPSLGSDTQSNPHTGSTTLTRPSNNVDISQAHLVTHRNVKEPPSFRGDGSDSVDIEEWEDLMRAFVKKGNMNTAEHVEEILVHLRGRAKDVVKFWIRNSESDTQTSPNAIYSLLRKHFSCSQYSPVPLSDFYTTLPNENEEPYDYWLRLNKAADVASECLMEQGKSFDNPGTEIAHMFIRHCPSKDLALTFRSKSIDKWSAHEVQAVLNAHKSESSFKPASPTCCRRTDKTNVCKVDVNAASVACKDSGSQQCGSTEQANLERVIDMLEKVLMRNSGMRQPSSGRRCVRLPRIDGLDALPCAICNDGAHSALVHCREHRLCFQCLSPGHARRNCPVPRVTLPPSNQGN